MSTLNRIIVLGRLGKDPTLRHTNAGTSVTNLSLATDHFHKGPDGTTNKSTDWHNAVLWGRIAEIVCKYAHKGDSVLIEGRMTARKFTDKDGIERETHEIVANDVRLIGRKSEPQHDPFSAPARIDGSNADFPDDDDIPF